MSTALILLITAVVVKQLVQILKPLGVTGDQLTPVVAGVTGVILTWVEHWLHAPGLTHWGAWLVTVAGVAVAALAGFLHDSQRAFAQTYTGNSPTDGASHVAER